MQSEEMKRNWEEQDRVAILSVYSELASNPVGRKFLWHLLQLGKFCTQPFTPNALNTAFACGELNVGNGIFSHLVEASPDAYMIMQKENYDEQRSRSERILRADPASDSWTE